MTETRVKSKKKIPSVYKKKLYQMSNMYREQFNVLSSKKKIEFNYTTISYVYRHG